MQDLFGTEALDVQIKVITIDGKRMSRGIFLQIIEEMPVSGKEIDKDKWEMSVKGILLGYIIYEGKKYLIWKKENELRTSRMDWSWLRTTEREHISNPEAIEVFDTLPHLFIGG